MYPRLLINYFGIEILPDSDSIRRDNYTSISHQSFHHTSYTILHIPYKVHACYILIYFYYLLLWIWMCQRRISWKKHIFLILNHVSSALHSNFWECLLWSRLQTLWEHPLGLRLQTLWEGLLELGSQNPVEVVAGGS